MRHYRLQEYQTTESVQLTREERDALRKLAPSISVFPTVGKAEGYYDLTPSSWIGLVRLGDLLVEIHPKIPIGNVLFLLSYAVDPKRWFQRPFDLPEDCHLHEAIIPGFTFHLRQALRRGILQDYRLQEEALTTVRGQIRFGDQIRDRFGIFPPVEVRYDDYTEDNVFNQLLKAAIALLRRLPIRSREVRRLLVPFCSAFQRVSYIHFDPRHLPELTYTPLNEHYQPAVELAKWIIRCCGFELGRGAVPGSCFLVNMNDVFENFVVVALRQSLGLTEKSFPQGAKGKGLYLDEARRVHLKPDLSWWNGGRCTFAGDVKYKKIGIEKIKHPDLYQVLAYCIAADLPGALLIYAKGEEQPVVHHLPQVNKSIEVVTLDLDACPGEILKQIDRLADVVKRMRAIAPVQE